jgi:ankyrin repeat protein
MVNALLEMQGYIQMINGRDRNGETPLHLACFHTNLDIALRLLSKGSSFHTKNIYGKDPIDIIPNYTKRKEFIRQLIKNRPKMHVKETDILKMHKRQCVYLEAMAEIIFA